MSTEHMELKLATDIPHLGYKAGQRVTLALQPSDVHDATELPTYLAGYKPYGFRADEASPPILVDNDSDKYRTFSSNDAFRLVDVKTAGGAKVKEVDPGSSLATYNVVERAIGSFIPTQTQGQSGNAYDPRMAAGRRCRRAIDLDREFDVFNTILGTNTSFAAAQRTALGANQNWNEGTSSNPIRDIMEQIEASDQPVTGIWFNQTVAHAFIRNNATKDHMRQMLGDSAVNAAVTNIAKAGDMNVDFTIPGLPPFHVAAAKYLNETASTIDFVMPNVCTLITLPPGVPTDGEEIATTYTWRRRGPSGTGVETREFILEDRGSMGGTMVVVTTADDEVVTANNAGGIITSVIV